MTRILTLLVWLVVLPGGLALAQHEHGHHPGELSPGALEFLEAVRAATVEFESLDAAIAAGYRRIGPDMPSMGEHWIHIRKAVTPGVDPSNPPVLTYLRIDGVPRLTGVAFTQPVLPGAVPPPLPFPEAHWHRHAGTVEEELLGDSHDAFDEGPYLAMFHAWTGVENPDGIFAADNWALSYERLGLDPPAAPSPEESRALFLATEDGVEYYLRTFSTALGPEAVYSELPALFETASTRIVNLLSEAAESPASTDLCAIWQSIGETVRDMLIPSDWRRVSAYWE